MIITLCGSARFEPWFHHWNELLSLSGHSVFSLGIFPSWKEGKKNWYNEEEKRMLDQVHIAKIINSDCIFVLNVFGYIGDSTMNEIEAARIHGKGICFLQSWGKGCGIGPNHSEKVREKAFQYIPEGYTSPINTSWTYNGINKFDLFPSSGDIRSSLASKDSDFRIVYEGCS